MIAIHTVGTGDKGILFCQLAQQRRSVIFRPQELCLFHREIIRHTQPNQKFPLTGRQGTKQHLVYERIDICGVFRPFSGLRIGPQLQIDHGEPSLGTVGQHIHIPDVQKLAAPACIFPDVSFAEPQIVHIQFPQAGTQLHLCRPVKDHVAGKQNNMGPLRQVIA